MFANSRFWLISLAVVGAVVTRSVPLRGQEGAAPIFRSGTALVPIAAVVHDSRHRLISALTQADFQILDQGLPQTIINFRADSDAPVSIAVLFDTSGSMAVGSHLAIAQGVVAHVLSWMRADRDEVALFTFDKQMQAAVPFTNEFDLVRDAMPLLHPQGLTSLFDAIAAAARATAARPTSNRAVVVVTDGVDTSSQLSAAEVSGIASASDVPVYVIAALDPIDVAPDGSLPERGPTLSNLAEWTGGRFATVSGPADESIAVRELVNELRSQYVLAIEAARSPGWHPVEVRTRKRDLIVRARSGYFSDNSSVGPTVNAPEPLAVKMFERP